MVLLVILVLCLWLIIVATIKFVDITVTASLVGLACAILLILAIFIIHGLCSKSSKSTGRSEEQDVENNRIYTIGSSSNYPTESPRLVGQILFKNPPLYNYIELSVDFGLEARLLYKLEIKIASLSRPQLTSSITVHTHYTYSVALLKHDFTCNSNCTEFRGREQDVPGFKYSSV